MFRFACYAAVVFAIYWFGFRGGCGTKGHLACPPPALEEGVGLTLDAAEVCDGSGYLCAERRHFQVTRWALDKGRLRVRVNLPDFLDGKTAEQVRAAAIEGIMTWDGHPFPLVIDSGKYTLRFWDIGVVWTEGLFNGAAGFNRWSWKENGKRLDFSVDGLTVVVPPISGGRPDEQLLERVKAVAIHEMGHALGLQHSNSPNDIMYPQMLPTTQARLSDRDLQTIEAFYALPNGATVQ